MFVLSNVAKQRLPKMNSLKFLDENEVRLKSELKICKCKVLVKRSIAIYIMVCIFNYNFFKTFLQLDRILITCVNNYSFKE